MSTHVYPSTLFDCQQLDVEAERGVPRYLWRTAALAVPELGRHGQPAPAAHPHPRYAGLPPLDHLARPQREAELAGRVELRPVLLQGPLVAHRAGPAPLSRRPGSLLHRKHILSHSPLDIFTDFLH